MGFLARKEKKDFGNNRINILVAIIFLAGSLLVARLFYLQVSKFDFYANRAENQHRLESRLLPERGEIFIRDGEEKGGKEVLYPFAANKEFALLYAIPNEIETDEQTRRIGEALFAVFDEEAARKEIDEFFEKKDKDELAYSLSLFSSLPADEKKMKEAEAVYNFNLLRSDKTWLALREEKKKLELETKKKEAVSKYSEILNKFNDPYEPLKKKVDENQLKKLYSLLVNGVAADSLVLKNGKILIGNEESLNEKEVRPVGVYHSMEKFRYYPENNTGSHVLGFVRVENGETKGNYGLEGFFNNELAGQAGYLKSEAGARREVVILNDREYVKPKNGADLVLTINRSVEFFACQKIKEAMEKHGATGASLVAVEPSTGAVIAMCAVPDFDPNNYQKAEEMSVFNNPVVFDQYEPGSVMKAVTMAAALNEGKVTPETIYNDQGSVIKKGWEKPIKNSDFGSFGAHGWVDMNKVLELSLNTGAIFAREQVGEEKFTEYIKAFGFGEKTGIELDGESAGNIENLTKKKTREIDLDSASFGQAIMVTPLQMVMSYAAIANNGILMKPFLVKEMVYEDGSRDITTPREVRRVISERTANLLLGMLVNVVENGHAKKAKISGYFIAGKTGTAQVAMKNGYSEDTIQTFIGIAPADDPKFVMLIRMDRPKDADFAEQTVVPLYREIADFMLKYYQVPKER